MDNDIWFYEPDNSYGYLSNFSNFSFDYNGVRWKTSEHCYQASKYCSEAIVDRIRFSETPEEAFRISRQNSEHIRDDWSEKKYDVMESIIVEKFDQNRKLAHFLLSTGDAVIKEHSSTDAYWGDGGDGSGENNLGKILMTVRDSLKQKPPFNLAQYVDSSIMPTDWGTFLIHVFEEKNTRLEHVALSYGDWKADEPVPVRIHSECLTGDAFSSRRCDCGYQLDKALDYISSYGKGAVLYLRQEGRGIGLANKIRAYHLQDLGADTVQANIKLGFAADQRKYDVCEGIFSFLHINKIQLMTNNPEKIKAMDSCGVSVVERIPIMEGHNIHNHRYLHTKMSKMGHLMNVDDSMLSEMIRSQSGFRQ